MNLDLPSTVEMLAALDSALGGRAVVLECLRERAEESGRVGFPISELWKEYCSKPSETNNAAPEVDKDLATSGSASASAESSLIGGERSGLEPLGAAPIIGVDHAAPGGDRTTIVEEQNGLFSATDLPDVPAKPGIVQSIYVHFETYEDLKAFAELIGQPVNSQTRVISYPPMETRS